MMQKKWIGIMTALAGVLLVGTGQAEVSTWTGAGSNSRMITAGNWDVAPTWSNTNDLVLTTGTGTWASPGSTFGNITARSITYTNISGSDYSFGINRSVTAPRNLTMISDSGNATLTVDSGVSATIGITATYTSEGTVQNPIILGSHLDVVHNGSSTLTLSARITGTNDLTKVGLGELILSSANNDYTGSTTVSDGTLTLSGNLLFDINTNANNNLTGTGVVNLDGAFVFDLTDATAEIDDSWMIVEVNNLTATFSETFSVVDFVDAGDDTWTRSIDTSKSYVFSESTGLLTVEAGSVNSPPTAEPQTVSAYTDTPVDFTLSGTDLDGPSNLTYTVVLQPTYGTLDVSTIPDVTYTPMNGYNGADSFTFTVFDGLDESEPATVSIDVLNYVPVADTKFAVTQLDTPVAITLSGSDPEGNSLTYSVSQPANGTLDVSSIPDVTYTPMNGFTGVDSFTYTVNDGDDDSTPATVTISVSADGITLPFEDLGTALLDNTLNIGGILADVTGVITNLDYVYSVSFTGVDFDGDAANDEVTFDVRVKAWTNGVTDLGFDGESENVSSNISSATIGTSNIAVNVAYDNFTTAGNTMIDGSSLEFIIENPAVTLTDPNQAGSAASTGFTDVLLAEINKGNSHQTIFGEGTDLLGWMWGAPNEFAISEIDVDPEQLYVSASATTNTAATRPFNWGVKTLDFGINITLSSSDIPPLSINVSGSDLVFSWEGGGTYDVLSSESIALPDWGVAIPNATSSVSAPIGSESVLFYKLSE